MTLGAFCLCIGEAAGDHVTSDVAVLCCEAGRVGVLLGCLDAGLFVCFDWFYLFVLRDARDLFGQAHHGK